MNATDTTTIKKRAIELLIEDIHLMQRDWEEGRNASPSQLDWVLSGDEILSRIYPDYIGSTPEGRDFLADELYEDAGEKYGDAPEIAAHVIDCLMAE